MCAEGKKTSDPAEAAEPGSSENIKPGRVRPRDDAPTAAGAKNPVSQTDGRPGAPGRPGSRPQPTGAAARTRGRRETERTQADQAEETGASGTDHAPAAGARRRETSKEARGPEKDRNMLTQRKRAKTAAAAAVIAPIIALLMVIAYQGAAAAQGQPPTAPQNPMAHLIAGDGQDPQVRVSWDAPAQGTAASHTVSRNDSQNFESPGGATTYSDRAIVPGTTYSYTVTAENAAGSSPASASATASVPPAPSAPGSLAGSVAEPQAADETATVTLTWTASTVPEAASCETAYPLTGYTIVRSGGDQETELGTADAGATSFTDSAAAFSTEYTYRVIAQSAIGASPASETPVERILATRAPTHGAHASIADPFDGSISLSWTAPSEGADIEPNTRYTGTWGPTPTRGPTYPSP